MKSWLLLFVSLLGLGAVPPALAQTWPTQPVRIIVPFPAGGGMDVMIRPIAVELAAKWGKPVVIDNVSGAGSIIGAEAVARAAPDGYTLLATINFTLVANRYLYKSLPYDPDRSFAPVTLMVQSDQFLVATPDVKARDLKELVTFARHERGKLNYGSFGPGTQPHLVYGLLAKREGLDIEHIPYKGWSPVMLAMSTGEIQLTTASAGAAGPMIKSGRIKALAIAGDKRSAQFPDVPTVGEQGYPYLRAPVWYGLLAPARTPPAIIDKIQRDIAAILHDPAFAEKQVTSRGLDVVASTPQAFAAVIREDVTLTGEMVKAVGIQPE
jgi:tripartite-type tricarboxylate transporter receptor subunit TctC